MIQATVRGLLPEGDNMYNIAFTSPEHKTRFLAATQQIGKMDNNLIDREYGAALYILTSDSTLWNIAKKYVRSSGIRFDRILEENVFSSGEATIIKLAANLFYSRVDNFPTAYPAPVELVWLGENYFLLAISALNLRYYGLKLGDLTE